MTIWDINPWFMLLASLPYTCLGGFCAVILGTICYITDISDEQERGWQLAWMDALIYVAIVTGILVGPIIYEAYGYTVVFVSSTICSILAGLYVYCLVPETIRNTDSVRILSIPYMFLSVYLSAILGSSEKLVRYTFDQNTLQYVYKETRWF